MIEASVEDGVGFLLLNRPERRNALRQSDWVDLARGCATVAAGHPRMVILGSVAHGMFCAGSDLDAMRQRLEKSEADEGFGAPMRKAISAIAGLPVPVVAAIDGPCFGAGVALALAADIRVFSPGATVGIPPAKLGISYPYEDIRRLVALVGIGQAARLLLTAETIAGEEAWRIGLGEILHDVPMVHARALARGGQALSIGGVIALKAALRSVGEAATDKDDHDAEFERLINDDGLRQRLAR